MTISLKAFRKTLVFLLFTFFAFNAYPQQQVTIMTYNLLKFGENAADRLPCFRIVLDSIQPEILVVQEILSQSAVDLFHQEALNATYNKGTFIDGPDTDNGIFYKHELFTFISNTPIPTNLRNISEFKLVYKATGDTLRIYSVHLKASTGSANENQRLQEVAALRSVTDILPEASNFIVCGDFNIYKSSEPAYQALLNDTRSSFGHFVDPIQMTGTWNNSLYAPYHTQSTRTRQFGGGAAGGLDDRFDMILFSQSIATPGRIQYVHNSTWPVGNDGMHYNDSINHPPNALVSQAFANALHCASDHLPLIAKFVFGGEMINMNIPLHEGWNGISINLETVSSEIATLVLPLGEVFIALQSDKGIYYPQGGINTIVNWDYQNGYAIKVSEPAILTVSGYKPDGNTLIIQEGWNLIPILSDSAIGIEALFGQNLPYIYMIKEVAGVNVFWPEMGLTGLQHLKPKTSYYLKSNQMFTVDFN